jgi:hypothetical protein
MTFKSTTSRSLLWACLTLCGIACSSAETDSPGGATGAGAGTGAGASPGTGGQPTGTGGTGTPTTGAGGSVGGGTATGQGGTAPGTGGTTPVAGSGGEAGTVAGGAGGAGGSGGTGAVTGDVWIAPDGDDFGNGSEATPFRSLAKAVQVAKAGTTIWVKAGTYPTAVTVAINTSGTEGNLIKVFAVPGARPVFDYATQARNNDNNRGIVLQGSYWHFKGLEIKNAADNGILVRGGHNTIEDVIFHHNGDTGLQITVSEGAETNPALGAYNLILNCDSYENLDAATDGENADGFAAKERVGPGNIFRGCRAWNNADDGYDFFAADDVVTLENCWAFLNGKAPSGSNPQGDGNGFKLGGEPDGPGQGHAPHVAKNCSAFDNKACGFTRNNNEENPVLSQCHVGNNGDDYCDGASCSGSTNVSTSGSAAKSIARNADGSLPALD